MVKIRTKKIKIIDWGFATLYHPQKKVLSTCGTLEYLAPECLDPKQEHIGYEPDIWALGVILYYMIFGHVPFRAPYPFEVTQKIKDSKLDFDKEGISISNELQNMFEKIFVEHNKRPEITELMNHPWLKLTTITPSNTQKKREKFRDKRSISAITTIPEIDEDKVIDEKSSTEVDPNEKRKRKRRRKDGKKIKRSRSLIGKKKMK